MPPSNASQQTAVGVDRITVALIPKAAEALQRLMESTGLSKTDIVNRALTLYEYIDSQQAAGNDIILRDKKSGDTEVIRLL